MSERHFTTRRGFIAGLGFGAVSLYGAWAAYGAAPLPFGGHKDTDAPEPDAHRGHGAAEAPAEAGGHGGHGASAGMAPEEFRFEHDYFIQRYTQKDGSVNPHASEATHSHAAEGHDHGHDAGGEPVDVYLMAQKFAYSPDVLRLKAGQAYRFRMMADDITHGASIQLGSASRIIRLRPGTVTEQVITFTKPGEYLVYCTVYCGQAHDAMQGRIVVA
ncbi:cupredoxin-like protein [Azospirillum brasilense]|nr:cupredoxin-like protein [Azospirillum brasilense]